MNARGKWPAIGSIVALGMVSVLLSIGTLAGFQSSSAGDLIVTSTPGSWMSVTILLTGTLALVSLELVRVKLGRQRHASLAGAPGRRSWRPGQP
jgi:hypothetical protein